MSGETESPFARLRVADIFRFRRGAWNPQCFGSPAPFLIGSLRPELQHSLPRWASPLGYAKLDEFEKSRKVGHPGMATIQDLTWETPNLSEDTERLRHRILRFIESMGASESFDRLALDVFAYQFEHCAPFRELCRFRKIEDPRVVHSLSAIPAVPTDTFKMYRIACFPPSPREIRFETSGTTRGQPGIHVMPDTEIYDAAALPWFQRHVLFDTLPRRFLSLTGSPASMPRSSLVHMIDRAARRFGIDNRADYFFENETLDLGHLVRAVEQARERAEAVLVLTTAFALVHLIETAADQELELALPQGSRVMETGGYKGRSRELLITDLYQRAALLFDIAPEAIVNEYGMTEMSSQFYDRTDPAGAIDPVAERIKTPPPWVRSTVLRPATLTPVEPGEIGMLSHIDLANLHSCSFLLTADAAIRDEEGFVLLGRLSGSDHRGCSLDYERTA